jgi:hypothetical protein
MLLFVADALAEQQYYVVLYCCLKIALVRFHNAIVFVFLLEQSTTVMSFNSMLMHTSVCTYMTQATRQQDDTLTH